MMRVVLAGLAAVTLAGCMSTNDTPPANPQNPIGERVAIMKSFGGAMGAAAAFAQGKGTAQAAHAKLGTARSGGTRLASLFPRGTALGDKGADKSRALATIYQNRPDFEAKLGNALSALAKLDEAVMRGATADTTAALNATKATCGACHSKYRAADD